MNGSAIDHEQFRVALTFYRDHGWKAEGDRLLAILDAQGPVPATGGDAFTCPHPGCTQTDGKPCAYPECPNREAQA